MKVKLIPLSQIEFGTRRREDYGDIEELAESIKQEGLIQPLAVSEQSDKELPYLLLAGGRRFKALTSINPDNSQIPVRIYPPLSSDAEMRAIELAENYHRKDLSWEEQVALKREIHEAQVAIHGEKISTAPDAEGWTNEKTAQLLGVSKQSVQKDIQLAKAVETAPQFFEGCKNKSEATKVMKKIAESMIQAEMVKRAKKLKPVGGDSASLINSYHLQDCFLGMKNLEPETFKICEIDPPYGIDLKNAKLNGGDNLEAYNEVQGDMYEQFLQGVLQEAYRLMSAHSWLVFWFAPEPYFETVYQAILKAGFSCNRMCGIWTKHSGQSKRPETNLSNSYEMFFLARKGKPVLVKQGRSNVFDYAPVPAQKKIHPTERPIELISEILGTLGSPGSKVLVPFAGSGTTILSAHQNSMTAIGFDTAKEYQDRFILRVSKLGEI